MSRTRIHAKTLRKVLKSARSAFLAPQKVGVNFTKKSLYGYKRIYLVGVSLIFPKSVIEGVIPRTSRSVSC